jgi:hypothetical protein
MNSIKILYLNLIKIYNIDPNFFISKTYFDRPELKAKRNDNWVWIEENGKAIFPALPIYLTKQSDIWEFPFVSSYWCGFDGDVNNEWLNLPENKYFLDYQYIYDPNHFLDLSGGKWESFRKNVRRFLKREKGYSYDTVVNENDIYSLLHKWLEFHKKDAQDAPFIVNHLLEPAEGDYIKYLHDKQGNLLAVNYADENYKYINYRFIIADRKKYVDEFARYCFYTDPYILSKNKLVNDGGTLGFEGLERFKDKLNPLKKIKMYSWNENYN